MDIQNNERIYGDNFSLLHAFSISGKITVNPQASIQLSTVISNSSKGSKSFTQLGEIGTIFDFF